MYIATGPIIGYKYSLYYDTTLLHENDEVLGVSRRDKRDEGKSDGAGSLVL